MAQTKNNEIEMLRAFSIMLVVLSHIPFYLPWESAVWGPLFQRANFWFGVDIFFVISGYVVTTSLLREITPGARPARILASFAIRRAYRLLPLSWTVLATVLVLSLIWYKTEVFGSFYGNLSDAVAVLFYSANWHFYECATKAVEPCGIHQGLYWSLSLEEQFYIVLPLVIVFARKYLMAICIGGMLLQLPLDRDIHSALWITRTDALLVGVLIALCRNNNPGSLLFKPDFLRNDAVRIPLLVFILTGMALLAAGSVVSFSVSLIALGGGALVWAASFNEGLLLRKQHSVLVWIGSRSYAIYLLHNIAFISSKVLLAGIVGDRDKIGAHAYSISLVVVGLGLTAVLAELSARYLEKPLQKHGRRIAERLRNPIAIPTEETPLPVLRVAG
ncbi:acyltransferase family protein [Mesorhizobium calcicola]|uniref:Acyltransferase family protein n=1 Tax=Mesorhizobium calcicola TaxID=1300310 RepID=A0ABW4WQQ4_9HYPH